MNVSLSRIGVMVGLAVMLGTTSVASADEARPINEKELTDLIASSERAIEERVNTPKVFVAVSLSMPEGSLLRLANDAKDAGVPLIVRGVPVQPKPVDRSKNPNHQPTMKELYGEHLLVRGMAAFEFLVKTGVTLQIDPRAFDVYAIKDVPQLVMVENDTKPVVMKVRGDVTLRYALEHLEKQLERRPSQRALLDYTRVLLDRLGGRP